MENEFVIKTMQQNQTPVNGKTKKPVKTIILAVLVMIMVLGIQLLVSTVGCAIYMASCAAQTGGDMELAQQIYMDSIVSSGLITKLLLLTTALTMIIGFLWYRFGIVKKVQKEHWLELRTQLLHAKSIVLLTFSAIGSFCAAIVIARVIATLSPGTAEAYGELMSTALSGSEVLSLITVILIAPLAEELIFRGIIFRNLEKNLSAIAAILLQAALFSIYHLNILQGLYVLPLGLLLGYVAYKTRSILPCIYIHMVYNSISPLLSILPENTPLFPIYIILLVVWIVASFIIWKKMALNSKLYN